MFILISELSFAHNAMFVYSKPYGVCCSADTNLLQQWEERCFAFFYCVSNSSTMHIRVHRRF